MVDTGPHRPQGPRTGPWRTARGEFLDRVLGSLVEEVDVVDGWGKVLAVAPGMVVSTVLLAVIGAALPGPPELALWVAGLACTVALVAGRGEGAAARLLWGARPARPGELRVLAPAVAQVCRRGFGPPVVELRVRGRESGVTAGGVGRRTVVVSRGLIDDMQDGRLPADQAAALMVHAAALVRAGLVRFDPAIRVWSLPWLAVRGAVDGIATAFGALPLTRLVWRGRAVVAAIAVAQTASQGYAAIGGVIAVATVLSYAAPAWERRWQRRLLVVGDREAAAHGMAAALARYLRTLPATTIIRERLAELESGSDRAPVGVVDTLR